MGPKLQLGLWSSCKTASLVRKAQTAGLLKIFKSLDFSRVVVVVYVQSSSANGKDIAAANLETLYACLGVCVGSKALKQE